jgi:hypothetical protein
MADPIGTTPGGDPLAGAMDGSERAPLFAEAGAIGPELKEGKFERPPFPPACPVTPLGIASGEGKQVCFYLDPLGQLSGLECGSACSASIRAGSNTTIPSGRRPYSKV